MTTRDEKENDMDEIPVKVWKYETEMMRK